MPTSASFTIHVYVFILRKYSENGEFRVLEPNVFLEMPEALTAGKKNQMK